MASHMLKGGVQYSVLFDRLSLLAASHFTSNVVERSNEVTNRVATCHKDKWAKINN